MALKHLSWCCGGILWLFLCPIYGQTPVLPLDTLLVQAQVLQNQNRFQEAIAVYQAILRRHDVVPATMCYQLGRTLYAVQMFGRSERFLTHYLKEVPINDAYYTYARALRDSARIHLARIKACVRCDSQGWRYQQDTVCKGTGSLQQICPHCGGQRIRTCPTCFGQSVLISVSVFSQTLYHPCAQCKGRGYIPCSSCKGHGHLQKTCTHCKGSGRVKSSIRCTHSDEH